ncbi:MAG: aldehyde dehydrogenase family protein [Propionibacteriaceae bacterium]
MSSNATINPATGELVKSFDAHSAEEVEAILDRAAAANVELATTTIGQRGDWIRTAADLLETDLDELALVMVTEMGKTKASAEAEVKKCATALRFYADHAAEFLADETVEGSQVNASSARVVYQPLGTVLAIMPWNFPVWQVIRFAAPGLMAGNSGVLKHALNVPQTALYLGDLFTRAGFPAGAFQAVLVDGVDATHLIEDPRIAAVTLTGSVPAGHAVGAAAGGALKKTVLELGGSDAFIVLPSADLDKAVQVAVTARTQNSGQSCIAAKRFFVHADIYDVFTERFVEAMGQTVAGDPLDPATTFGPLATERGRDGVHSLVEDAVEKGATLLVGGTVPDRPGWFYPATVVADLTPDMRIWSEECFGPVASLYRVDSVEQAIAMANDSEFGLSSAAFTNDEAEIDLLTTRLQAGGVFINGMTVSFPQLPFGGIKSSGYGRELSIHGIHEFCNVKTVWRA